LRPRGRNDRNPTPVAGAVSGYSSAASQSYTVGVSEADGALVASTETLWLSADTAYTLVGFARLGAVKTFALVANQLEPARGFASFAIANTSGDAGALDGVGPRRRGGLRAPS
jgi:hypothetical protein